MLSVLVRVPCIDPLFVPMVPSRVSIVPVLVPIVPGVVFIVPGVLPIVPVLVRGVLVVLGVVVPGVVVGVPGVVWAKAMLLNPIVNRAARNILVIFIVLGIENVKRSYSVQTAYLGSVCWCFTRYYTDLVACTTNNLFHNMMTIRSLSNNFYQNFICKYLNCIILSIYNRRGFLIRTFLFVVQPQYVPAQVVTAPSVSATHLRFLAWLIQRDDAGLLGEYGHSVFQPLSSGTNGTKRNNAFTLMVTDLNICTTANTRAISYCEG